MAMKKIKPQYGKVSPPILGVKKNDEAGIETNEAMKPIINDDDIVADQGINTPVAAQSSAAADITAEKSESTTSRKSESNQESPINTKEQAISKLLNEPNPFMQTKEIFGKARLTKVGYRVRTDFVEILDFIKKMKKNGYTLEAVLDDALAFYFENSEDGREAIKKAEAFYS